MLVRRSMHICRLNGHLGTGLIIGFLVWSSTSKLVKGRWVKRMMETMIV